MVSFLVVAVLCLTFYKFVELLARRKERRTIVEKMDFNKTFEGQPQVKMPSLGSDFMNFGRFTAFRIGMALLGIGLGIMIAFFIVGAVSGGSRSGDVTLMYHEARAVAYPASAMLFGGIALIASFLIEQSMRKNDKKKSE